MSCQGADAMLRSAPPVHQKSIRRSGRSCRWDGHLSSPVAEHPKGDQSTAGCPQAGGSRRSSFERKFARQMLAPVLQVRQMKCYRQMRWKPPVTPRIRSTGSMEAAAFNQFWRYWLGCHARQRLEVQVGWRDGQTTSLKTGVTRSATNGKVKARSGRQVWRFRQASEKLLSLCEDATEKIPDENEILVHPGLPQLISSGYRDALWHPEKVAKIMDYLIEEHDAISMNRGSTMTWMQLREQLPQNWIGEPLESTTPTTAIFGIIRTKQRPRVAVGELDEQMIVKQAKTDDPAECPFEELRTMTLAEFARSRGEKAKRRITCLRSRWEAFEAMLSNPEGHSADPLWQASRVMCARCHAVIAMSRIGVAMKAKCRGTCHLHDDVLHQWQEETGRYLKWLKGPLEVHPLDMKEISGEVDMLGDADWKKIYAWLSIPTDRPKGLVIGRIRAEMAGSSARMVSSCQALPYF